MLFVHDTEEGHYTGGIVAFGYKRVKKGRLNIREVRVGRDYNIEIVLNVPLDEFEEFKRHAASAGRGKNQKNKSQNPQKVGRCTSNAGIVVLDKTAGETISIVPKNAAHAILRC